MTSIDLDGILAKLDTSKKDTEANNKTAGIQRKNVENLIKAREVIDAFLERASILEYDGHMNRSDAEEQAICEIERRYKVRFVPIT